MVDAPKGIGGAQNLPSSHQDRTKIDTKKGEAGSAASSITPVEISLSEEAQALAAAEQDTQALKQGLQNDQDLTLSKGQGLSELL
ncbi:MAG: hypothetical protein CMH27_02175 [Micavibrio sp.]|nr:hypothetical protein [Micavibrio sp.]|tara:strand:+ start:1939 stop:2193 length:255 start_codon:yes stop_codon:yes gene_type:complete